MGYFNIDWKFPFFTRDKAGDTFYDLITYDEWSKNSSNLSLSLSHPILTPALLFIAKLFSQTQIDVINSSNKKVFNNHEAYALLKKPNWSQTLPDLLESLIFTTIANGVGVIYKKRTYGRTKPNSLYVLNYNLIEFPDSIKKGNLLNASRTNELLNTVVVYDKDNENIKINLKDLIFFYDLPNNVDPKNPFNTASRIDGMKKTLFNTQDSIIAKSIIIRSNGKELISGAKDGFPLKPDEKEKIEERWANNYGLANTRKRGIITNASLKWQSLHLIMRDLGHDEGIKTDASIIFTGLHLPNDVYSISGEKSTYKNANQSLVSYIQNDMQSTANSIMASLSNGLLEDGYEFRSSFSHMPVMIEFEKTKYEVQKTRGEALSILRSAGLPDEIALELLGFEKGIKLNELTQLIGQQGEENNLTEEQEEKITELVSQLTQ